MVSKFKHELLYDLMKEYERSLQEKDELNNYFKTFLSLNTMMRKRETDREFKKKVSREVKTFLSKEKLNLNFLLKEKELKYSNTYNFLYKDQLSKLSREKALYLCSLVRNM